MTSVAELPLTLAETTHLVPSLSTRAQLLEIEQSSIHAARLWAMRPRNLTGGEIFTEGFLRELHRRMFSGIWRGAGRYRTSVSDTGWEPGRISEGMRLFLDDADGWARYSTYPIHECAVRLHHRLISVRPWSNGNGRHARLMADVAVAAQGETPLTWGSRSAAGSARSRYAEALVAADGGALGPLLDFAKS
jgi:Fic-DOC domain mobile mystery protein B